MRVELKDRDRISMLMIGQFIWTYDEPGPVEININELTPDEKKQLIYNWKRGALLVDEPEVFQEKVETHVTAKSYVTGEEKPVQKQKVVEKMESQQDPIDEDLKELKALLDKPVSSIKKALVGMPPGRIRKLRDLEQKKKKRKSLKIILDEMISKHESSVTNIVSGKDVGNSIHTPNITSTSSPNVSDIVESEVEEKEFNLLPPED